MWKNYSLISHLDQQPRDYQTALFLHCVGTEALKIYNGFVYSEEEDKTDLPTVIKKFDQHIIGDTNETFERYIFNERNQDATESIDSYVTALRTLAKTCNFCDCLGDSLLRDRIVRGTKDSQTRKRLLQQSNLTLKKCIDICRSAEAASNHFKVMSGPEDHVHRVQTRPTHKQQTPRPKRGNQTGGHTSKVPQDLIDCRFCTSRHIRKKEECPAWGKKCTKCGGRNHFAAKCEQRSRPNARPRQHGKVYSVQQTAESSDSEYVLGVEDTSEKVFSACAGKEILAKMLLGEQEVQFQIDSGATVNVLPVKFAAGLELEAYNKTLKMWNSTVLIPLGKRRMSIRNPTNGKKYSIEFVVVQEDLLPLLGKRVAEQMELITVNYRNFAQVASISSKDTDSCEKLLAEYTDVFDREIGTLPGKVHLHVDETVTPVTSATGRIPVASRSQVKAELNRLQKLGVIAPIDVPTDWTSRMVVATKKSGDLRICIDPKPLNCALKRERYQMPIMDEVLPELAKAKYFTKLDLSSGFWHVVLDYDSSILTTFQTGFGRFRWLRLPFGLNVSSEIFQKRLLQALEGLEGVICITDDIIVYGAGDNSEDASRNHDRNLEEVLRRCRERGITLNREKAEVKKTEISFLGHLMSDVGLRPDPKKVEAITKLQTPSSVEEVHRLNGTVNYLAKFLPRLSAAMEPIRQLTRKDVHWNWSRTQDQAFAEVKRLVTEAPLLSFYDPESELVIQCDASEKGLGAALLQHGKPVAFASRALTDVETRYAQIEKEMLAIVFSLQKFHQYTFGRHTTVHSDHKPLEAIVKKPLAKAPRRLQGMLLRVQQYDIEVIYCKGKEMHIADMLSRAYLPNDGCSQAELEQVNMVSFLPIRPERLQQIRNATEQDEVSQQLSKVILQGWPDDRSQLHTVLHPYFHVRDEMSMQDGIIFKGERTLIPRSLRSEIKKAIHSSHVGIDGCLRRARECVFWPGMSADIREYISTCETCRKYEVDQPRESLMQHDVPDRPWQKVGTDIFSFEGKSYLVTVDYFSNFWEIDRLEDTTTTTVIRKLKGHFARYGIPCHVVSDPGPQFTASTFHDFSVEWNFEHLLVSPANQKANGKAESAVKSAKRLMRKNKDTNTDQFLALLDVRNTPTQGVGSSPVQRLMNRRTRTLLPMTSELLKPRSATATEVDKRRLQLNQAKQKTHYDRSAHDLPVLEEGDTVRMRPFVQGSRVWRKAVVNRRLDERSYEVETGDGVYRRNRVQLRKSAEPPLQVRAPLVDDIINPQRDVDAEDVTPIEMPTTVAEAASTPIRRDVRPQIVTSRSGRQVKSPDYLKDYDCK